jgi:hypothetical protein
MAMASSTNPDHAKLRVSRQPICCACSGVVRQPEERRIDLDHNVAEALFQEARHGPANRLLAGPSGTICLPCQGLKVTEREMQAVNIARHNFHAWPGSWRRLGRYFGT